MEEAMVIVDRVVPGRLKTNLRRAILGLNQAARLEVSRQALPPRTATLWEAMCDGASDILHQLLVKNGDKHLDWGLKRARHKINEPRLVVMYWWLLLYQLVMFRNRGVAGYSVEEEFPGLRHAAHQFIAHLASSNNFRVGMPDPWEERWETQVSLEASLGLYNRVMGMLGMYVDLDKRIFRVSLFTSATERVYDSVIRRRLSERNGSV